MKYFLAIDLGASSGKHVVGYLDNGEVKLDEVYRFKTQMDETIDGLVWDIPRLLKEIKEGIKVALSKYKKIESLSIDTWGVDYVLMNGDKEIPPFYAYRNQRNIVYANKLHEIIPFEKLYQETGIQYAPFNTIYQLYGDYCSGRLNNATDYLMIPSYFIYKLTGVKTHEYTNESTGALLDPNNHNYNEKIINTLGLPKKLFGSINYPGYYVGELLPSIQEEVGGNIKVMLCATHDTASAFESVNIEDDSIIISSGTWSLLGIKAKEPIISEKSKNANYTNEGGVGYVRFLKNIMGMYLGGRLKTEVGLDYSYIDNVIDTVKYHETFDVFDESLLAPVSMKDAILKLLKNKPKDDLEIFASIFHSLALSYDKSIKELETITNKKYKKIYVIGGGAKNIYLNKLIEKYTKKEVIPLIMEATSKGNILVQMKASKL